MNDQRLKGTVLAVSISKQKGEKKINQDKVALEYNFGVEGDAHAGQDHRQVSFLAIESIEKMRGKGMELSPGDFAENITVSGVDISKVRQGDEIGLGKRARLQVTQIGKECHGGCQIFQAIGECVMPQEGFFACVLEGGTVEPGDQMEVFSRSAIKSEE